MTPLKKQPVHNGELRTAEQAKPAPEPPITEPSTTQPPASESPASELQTSGSENNPDAVEYFRTGHESAPQERDPSLRFAALGELRTTADPKPGSAPGTTTNVDPTAVLLASLKTQMNGVLAKLSDLPAVAQRRFIEAYQLHFTDKLTALTQPVPALPEVDSSGEGYPLYKTRTNALEHLETVWGVWLTRFNPEIETDYLYQDELHERDAALMLALRNQINYRNRTGEMSEKVNDYVPPRSMRVDTEIAALDEGLLKRMNRIDKAVRYRKSKQR